MTTTLQHHSKVDRKKDLKRATVWISQDWRRIKISRQHKKIIFFFIACALVEKQGIYTFYALENARIHRTVEFTLIFYSLFCFVYFDLRVPSLFFAETSFMYVSPGVGDLRRSFTFFSLLLISSSCGTRCLLLCCCVAAALFASCGCLAQTLK
ncbi:MAG: hypothetical protein H0U27_08365 [Nitrosopumilus sp.]|nr:hypothetical protein [Nitrosopumilus sp.]